LKKLKEFKEKFFLNGLIKSVQISFIQNCLIVGTFLMTIFYGEERDPSQYYKGYAVLFYVLFFIWCSYMFIQYNREDLMARRVRNFIGNLYLDIDVRSGSGVFYCTVFLLRQLLFGLIRSVAFLVPVFEM
jgi:hypothetical protein